MIQFCWLLLLTMASSCVTSTQKHDVKDARRADDTPSGSWWMDHLTKELLPFWDTPVALGRPVGTFPSLRCDNGTLLDVKNPCPEIARVEWMLKDRSRHVVALSRQTYGYGVAFHMTGDPRYLSYMKAGVDFIRKNAFDRKNGGTFAFQNIDTGAWGPDPSARNPQEMAYGLLGLAFYYYLTGDAAILDDIMAAKAAIFKGHYQESTQTMNWYRNDLAGGKKKSLRLTAHLDQMNTYMVLLTPLLSEPQQSQWKKELLALSRTMIRNFYVPKVNLFFLQADQPSDLDPGQIEADFGHTSKTLWMMRMVGAMTQDKEVMDFVASKGPSLLASAFNPETGTWIESRKAGGSWNLRKSWWVHAELDQFAGTLALTDPEQARYLVRTNNFWRKYFVDHTHGEVYYALTETNQPAQEFPKQWAWKNAYHSFEHALVGYITSLGQRGESVPLYYAFADQPREASLRPYFFQGRAEQVVNISAPGAAPVWKVVYGSVR